MNLLGEAPELLSFLFGPDFADAAWPMTIVLIGVLPTVLFFLGRAAILASGNARAATGIVTAATIAQFAALFALTPFYGASAMGFWSDERGTNLLDSGAPYYDVYRCADGGELAVAALEPQFFATLLDVLGIDPASVPAQAQRSTVYSPETISRRKGLTIPLHRAFAVRSYP